MSHWSWKERFARRAGGKARDLVRSGSPAIQNLRINPEAREVNSIAAIEALVRRHMPLLKAKRAIETVLTDGSHYLQVPKVEDAESLRSDLRSAGFTVRVAPVPGRVVDVKALREKLGTSQEVFAARYRISLDVLRNWEQRRNEPDAIARNMLEMIDRDPAGTERALWVENER
jgi:DNA-binding transcriptional regulator YiaG